MVYFRRQDYDFCMHGLASREGRPAITQLEIGQERDAWLITSKNSWFVSVPAPAEGPGTRAEEAPWTLDPWPGMVADLLIISTNGSGPLKKNCFNLLLSTSTCSGSQISISFLFLCLVWFDFPHASESLPFCTSYMGLSRSPWKCGGPSTFCGCFSHLEIWDADGSLPVWGLMQETHLTWSLAHFKLSQNTTCHYLIIMIMALHFC